MSRTKALCLLAVVSVFDPRYVYASNKMFQLTLEELLEVRVTVATRTPLTKVRSPSSVTVFTKQDINALGADNWLDLINLVPGFYSMMNPVEGNQSYLVMRGHAQKYANTLLVLINGHRINDDYTGGINYLMRYMDLNSVEQVEVIRGPGSAIYGSNAYSGVINIKTKVEPGIKVGFGEQGARFAQLNVSTNITDVDLGVALSKFTEKGDTFSPVFDRFGVQNQTSDPRQSQQIRLNIDSESTHIFGQYLQSERDNYYLFRRLRDEVTHIRLNHGLLGLTSELYKSEELFITARAAYQYASRESLTALTPKGYDGFDDTDFLFGESLRYRSAEIALDFIYSVDEDEQFSTGLSYFNSSVPSGFLKSNFDLFGDFSYLRDVITFDDPNARVVLDKTRRVLGVYGQYQWQVNSDLHLTTGLRYDSYNDVDNALVPRLGAVYQLSENDTLKLLYGRAYRSPSLGDLYDEESGLTLGSDNLDASEVETIELIWNKALEKVNWTATLFRNDQKNIIGFTSDTNDNVYLANVASNTATGIEIESVWVPSSQLTIKGQISYLFSNSTDKGSAVNMTLSEELSPESLASLVASYSTGHWQYNGQIQWRSSVNTVGDDGLWLVNSNVAYEFTDKVRVNFSVTNLFNKRYSTGSFVSLGTDSKGNLQQSYPARGRQALLSVTYQF